MVLNSEESMNSGNSNSNSNCFWFNNRKIIGNIENLSSYSLPEFSDDASTETGSYYWIGIRK